MPSLAEMVTFARNNPAKVNAYRHIILLPRIWAEIKDDIQETPDVGLGGGSAQTFAILIAMGYGSNRAREVILTQYAIQRLES